MTKYTLIKYVILLNLSPISKVLIRNSSVSVKTKNEKRGWFLVPRNFVIVYTLVNWIF